MKKPIPTEHLFMKIRNYVEHLVTSRELPPDARLPTETQLAELFGVSRLTVKRALSELVDRDLIYRIKGKGTFVTSRAEAALSPAGGAAPHGSRDTDAAERPQPEGPSSFSPADGKPDTPSPAPAEAPKVPLPADPPSVTEPSAPMVTVIMPDLLSRYASSITESLCDRLSEHGLRVELRLTHIDLEREKRAIVEAVRNGAKGIVIFPRTGEIYNEEILRLKIERFPHVLIDRYLRGIDNHSVCSDNYDGAYRAVRGLTDLGHRHIGILSHDIGGVETVEDRLNGALKAIHDAGGTPYPLCNIVGNWASLKGAVPDEGLVAQAEHYFRQYEKVTAVVTLNLSTALLVVYTLRRLERRIPDDLSMITFDQPGSPILHHTALACVAQDPYKMGEMAADALVELMEGRPVEKRMVVPVTLMEGESVGPPRSG
ncbi:GntR family transcriptional regulator [Paenibacillus arenilitoris]|uniref:Substrate-binding domain-containing protein n=1 Tax=Paenibacillus arenilitoris TaxID=2772299 RepID=A0A927H4Y6_9BACL|nr:GntR family transcriptional regulator [Paenibacillus arenilitoris]MBD2867872.1 substrate-binding domain-containing protein [Paenibacillus arenilitoris]